MVWYIEKQSNIKTVQCATDRALETMDNIESSDGLPLPVLSIPHRVTKDLQIMSQQPL